MRERLKQLGPFFTGVIGACLGVVLVLLVIHLWSDHVAFHALVNFINANGAKIQKLP